MKTNTVGRRRFLRGLGGVVIALPFLEALACGNADEGFGDGPPSPAGTGGTPGSKPDGASNPDGNTVTPSANGRPRRFLSMTVGNGTIADAWFPSGTGPDFALSPILQPLAPFKKDILVLKNIHNKVQEAGHLQGLGSFLTGRATLGTSDETCDGGGISVDQEMAKRLVAAGQGTAFDSLVLGTNPYGGVGSRVSYLGAAQPVPRILGPKNLFDYVFPGDPAEAARRRAARQSILDDALADYEKLRGQLGPEDRARLEAHLDAIREVERRIEASIAACNPNLTAPLDYSDTDRLPENMKATLDLIAIAMGCDLSRVFTFHVRSEGRNDSHTFLWLGLEGALTTVVDSRDNADGCSHHAMSHADSDPRNVRNLTKVGTWYVEQLAYLLGKLKGTPDGNGTLLDNCAVLYGSAISSGPSHSTQNLPLVLAGGAGGYFKTGRVVDCKNASLNGLHVSLLNAMGLGASTFGDPKFCSGAISALTSAT